MKAFHKQRWGQKPASGVSTLIGELECFMGRKWELYQMFDHPSDKGWLDFKLRLRGKGGGRVNYRIGWNPELDRFAGGHDYNSLCISAPTLHKKMIALLKENGFMRPDWVGLSPERKQ